MASKTYIWPETSPQAIQFWEISAAGPIAAQSVVSYLDGSGLAQTVDSTHGLPVALVAGSASIGTVTVASAAYTSQPTVTRPANQTPYIAGDVVGGVITFTTAGPTSGGVVITDADLEIVITAIPAGMTSFRLHLYSATPPSATTDNSPWTCPSGDRSVYLGYIDMGTPALLVAGAGFVFVQTSGINKKVLLGASTSLFAYLVTTAGFTPAANSEVYVPRLQTLGV